MQQDAPALHPLFQELARTEGWSWPAPSAAPRRRRLSAFDWLLIGLLVLLGIGIVFSIAVLLLGVFLIIAL
jgi:hypothetical protein